MEHVVLFSFKKSASAASMQELLDGIRSLKDRIPGVVDISLGCSFTARHKGYTHGLVVRLKDQQSLDAYQAHPAHVEVLKVMRQHVDNVIAGVWPVSTFLAGVALGAIAVVLGKRR